MSRRKPYELSRGKGPSIWRTVEDKDADPDELQKMAEEEKPGGFIDLLSPQTLVSRRSFVQGSSIAALAAGLQGCVRRPKNEIFPYSKAPEYLVPGVVSHFATVTARGRDALGVVVTSNDGRPTKVEGNAAHRRSLGGTDVRGQLYVWDLYDPDRSQSPARRKGNALANATDEEFDSFLKGLTKQHAADQGTGLRILAPISNSPSFRAMRDKVLAKFPKARFHTYSAINDDNAREGARMAFNGAPMIPIYDHAKSAVTVSIGSDFLGTEPGSVDAGRRFAHTRAIVSPNAGMNRLYVVESNFTVTGSMADHRERMTPHAQEVFARALVVALADRGVTRLEPIAHLFRDAKFGVDGWSLLDAVADDLVANQGRSAVVVGAGQPARIHALAIAINGALSNFGATTFFGPAIDADDPTSRASIAELANDADSISSLIIIGGNPVYDAPADVKFADLLKREGFVSVHLATHRNETSELCSWHVPLAHELEAWGDQQSLDGSVSVQQPLIAPLYGARSEIELLAALAGEKTTSGHDIVRETHAARLQQDTKTLLDYGVSSEELSADGIWRSALHTGVLLSPMQSKPPVDIEKIIEVFHAVALKEQETPHTPSFQVIFEPDPALHDGTHANNLWALELPHPMTKLVWDNAALISPTTAKELGVKRGQMLRFSKGEAKVEAPVWILPGHAEQCATLTLGWGRSSAGRYGNGKGFDVNPLRTTDAMDAIDDVTVEALPQTYRLVQTQTHDRMEGRPIAIDATLDEYKAEPDFASYRSVDPVNTPPLWKQQDYSEGHKWGMVIDLNRCTGCSACMVACQAENNVPAVGKHEVERGREMHWLRIDRYFVGDDESDPSAAVQPVTCQQCEEAPCENVCPVNATTHSPEGLNDMAYNRCVGTRYCANNCPYKVRRFNYLDWHGHLDDKFGWFKDFPESRKLQFNPNVTVRMRGVMEKCTYCVQRIQEGKIAAKRDGRELKDGDVISACQQACPTQAITFGDLNDPKSKVARLAKVNRSYKLLPEVGTRPRTSFLARIRNPNPKLKGNG
jgi:Fe-S-cluster-containing dehydrogenase component/anaerobic selenocysteine-containing dehydrogenase